VEIRTFPEGQSGVCPFWNAILTLRGMNLFQASARALELVGWLPVSSVATGQHSPDIALAAQRTQPVPTTGSAPNPPGEPADGPDRKGKRINEQMLGRLQREPESLYWSAQQWADALGCSKSTIAETHTWKTTIRAAKARERAEREMRQERRQGRSDA